jgi:hypothetical protein
MIHVRIEDLILLRCWCAGESGVTIGGLRQAIGGLLPTPPNAAMLRDFCEALVKDGLLVSPQRGRFQITARGEQTLAPFSLPSPPKALTWTKLKDTYLLAHCVGLSSLSKKPLDTIRVALLREACEIPSNASLTAAVDRFLRDRLRQGSAKSLKAAVIWRALGVPDSVGKSEDHLAPSSPAPAPVPVEDRPLPNLEDFAKTVTAAALRTSDGWLGNKVLISHVWRTIQAAREWPGMTCGSYKELLVLANRQGLVTLSRADLSHLLDQRDVQESEILYLNATFHFLTVNRNEGAL